MPLQQYVDSMGNVYWDQPTRAIHISPQEMEVYEARFAAQRAAEVAAAAKDAREWQEAYDQYNRACQAMGEAGYDETILGMFPAPPPEAANRPAPRVRQKGSSTSTGWGGTLGIIIIIAFVALLLYVGGCQILAGW